MWLEVCKNKTKINEGCSKGEIAWMERLDPRAERREIRKVEGESLVPLNNRGQNLQTNGNQLCANS